MKIFITVLLITLSCLGLHAQDASSFVPMSTSSAYSFEGTGSNVQKLKIKTYVWGQIVKPGLYSVPDDTDLLTLISLAGGPKDHAKLTKIRIVRPTEEGKKIIFINMKKYLETGDESMIPIMQPGDTVIVSGTTYYALTQFTGFLSQVALILSFYNYILMLQ